MIRLVTGVAAVAVVATACSGVPTSSAPQVIGPVLGAASSGSQPTDTPQPGAEPRAIVQEFLRANVAEPLDPRGPHEFLTPDEQRKWSDRTVTILQGSVEDADVGFGTPGNPHAVAVTVKGTQIGSLAAAGTYTPSPPASGGSGQPWSFTYGLDPVNGQFRISEAPDGLVVYADEFANAYRSTPLYFLDLAEKRLVPDVRYTALTLPQAAASWELTQLLAGPRDELVNAVRTEMPSQLSSARSSVTVNGLQERVELPGSSHLDSDVKVRLAAQLIATLGSAQPQTAMTITDGGVPIDITNLSQPFTRDTLAGVPPTAGANARLFDTASAPPVFYLDDAGRLVAGDGRLVDGPLGTGGRYDLRSVAVTAARADTDYYVAACIDTGSAQAFWVGRASSGLRQVPLVPVPHGPLTRPSWLTGQKEVWVANGSNLYRADYTARPVPTTAAGTVPTTLPPGARIAALRLSPEGSRIAMIVQSGSQSQLWVAAVVRTGSLPDGGTARLDSAEPITPRGYHLSDVAWSDDITLWTVGTTNQGRGIWSVTVDGAGLRERSSAGLPQPQAADSITTAPGVLPWVSARGYVFEQSSDWEGPGHRTTRGTNPVYQEGYLD